MSVTKEMDAIEATIDETLDVGSKRTARKKAKSRLEVYEKALKEVQQVAGNDPMRELSGWIQSEIREDAEPPSGRRVRQEGADICRDHGETISTGSWLGA